MSAPEKSPEAQIQFLGKLSRISRLDLQLGDRFVLQVDDFISDQGAAMMQAQWSDFIGPDYRKFPLLILQRGMKIGVIGAVRKKKTTRKR